MRLELKIRVRKIDTLDRPSTFCEARVDLSLPPEQLRTGTVEVRNVLGDDVPVTNKEIEDSLWHYYYDIDKTVKYLLSGMPPSLKTLKNALLRLSRSED